MQNHWINAISIPSTKERMANSSKNNIYFTTGYKHSTELLCTFHQSLMLDGSLNSIDTLLFFLFFFASKSHLGRQLSASFQQKRCQIANEMDFFPFICRCLWQTMIGNKTLKMKMRGRQKNGLNISGKPHWKEWKSDSWSSLTKLCFLLYYSCIFLALCFILKTFRYFFFLAATFILRFLFQVIK